MRLFNMGKGKFAVLLVVGLRPKPEADPRPLLAKYSESPSLQMLDACLVAGEVHLVTAATLAKKSWEAGENVSRTPANEVLLYASSKRQIREAIEFIGVKEDSKGWVAVAICESESQISGLMQDLLGMGTEGDSLIELDDSKCPDIEGKFGISEREISCALPLLGSRVRTVSSLVVERVSISSLFR